LARVHHPDHAADDAGTMSAVNEAYRVLGDPGRRARYDAELVGPSRPAATVRRAPRPEPVPVRTDDGGPARYPWKLVVAGAVVGAAVVLGLATFSEPSSPPPLDNVLEPGSCVAIEANDDAREVTCTESADDLVVERLVGLDEVCPPGLSAHRDRQGMGFACIIRRAPATSPGTAASLRRPREGA
jgi:molecular chaperone DnaJ